jgi:predicted acyl esterase
MGPWGHKYPQLADAGPGLDWVAEEVRWWTQWLLGTDTGIMDEPMLRVFMEYRTAAEVWPKDVPGRWVTEPSWPSPRIVIAYPVPQRGWPGRSRRARKPCVSAIRRRPSD